MKFRRGLALFAALILALTAIPMDTLQAATLDETTMETQVSDYDEISDAEAVEGDNAGDVSETDTPAVDVPEEDSQGEAEAGTGDPSDPVTTDEAENGTDDVTVPEEDAAALVEEAEEDASELLGDGTGMCTITYMIGDKNIAYMKGDFSSGFRYSSTENSLKINAPKNTVLSDDYRPDLLRQLNYKDMHYKFTGWSLSENGSLIPSDYAPNGNVTLYAQYDNSYHVITFHAGAGGYIERGSVRTEKLSERQEWIDKSSTYHEINYYGGFIDDHNEYFFDREDLLRNEDPAKTFAGWCTDENCTTPVTKYTNSLCDTELTGEPEFGTSYWIKTADEDINLYAKWVDNSDVVTLTLDPGEGGYFCDWQTYREERANKKYAFAANENISQRVANPLNRDISKKFLGWYDKNGNCVVAYDEQKNYDETYIGRSTNPDDINYGDTYDVYTISENTTLYARWANSAYHVITFDAGAGTLWYSEYGTETVKSAKTASFRTDTSGTLNSGPLGFPVSNNESQGFDGWYDNAGKRYFENGIEGYTTFDSDLTLTARYKDAWNVTIDLAGGYYAEDFDQTTGRLFDNYGPLKLKVVKGRSVMSAKNSAASLSTFIRHDDTDKVLGGIYLSTDTQFKNPLTDRQLGEYEPGEDTTFVIHWTGACTVTFDAGNGTIWGQKTVTYSVPSGAVLRSVMGDTPPWNPLCNTVNKVFTGWYLDPACTQKIEKTAIPGYRVNNDVTFYAGYEDAITITYDPNDETEQAFFVHKYGELNADGTYSVRIAKGAALCANVPTMDTEDTGRVFSGWYHDPDCMDEVNAYSDTFSSDTTLYAGWEDCFTLTFHLSKDDEEIGDATFADEDESTDDIIVKVIKGEPYRGRTRDGSYSAFEVPTVRMGEDAQYAAFPDWYDQDGNRVNFYASSTLRYTMGGFIPTRDLDLYPKWAEAVPVTFEANGKNGETFDEYTGPYFREGYIAYYGTMNEAKTACTIYVPKGVRFCDTPAPYPYSEDEDLDADWGYTSADCTQKVPYDQKIEEALTVYAKWVKRGGFGGQQQQERIVKFHALEGYFYDREEKVREESYSTNAAKWNNVPIPEIDDDTRVFAGWYTDEKLTKPFAASNTRFNNDYWGCMYLRIPAATRDLYAKYDTAAVVTFDANGGYFDDNYPFLNERTADPGHEIRETSILTVKTQPGQAIDTIIYSQRVRRDGNKIFGGWYLDRACTKRAAIYALDWWTEAFKPVANTTLYAKWITYSDAPEKIELSVKGSDQITIDIGESVDLLAKVTPQTTGDVHWIIGNWVPSADADYPVRLDITGRVTGQAKGSCTVHAFCNGVLSENYLTINVSGKQTTPTITLRDENGDLFTQTPRLLVGDTLSVKGVIDPESERANQASKVKWTSSNPAVATVVADGDGADAKITALWDGETTITATLGKKQDTLKVVVTRPVALSTQDVVLTAKTGAVKTVTVTVMDEVDTDEVSIAALDKNCMNVEGAEKLVVLTPSAWTDDGSAKTCDVEIRPSANAIMRLAEMTVITLTVTAPIEDGDYSEVATITLSPMQSVKRVRASIADKSEVPRGTCVLLSTATSDAKIYYTLNGNDPEIDLYETAVAENNTENCPTKLYDDAIVIDRDTEIRAIAQKDDMKESDMAVFRYIVDERGDVSSEMYADSADIPEGIWVRFFGENYEDAGTITTDFTTGYTGSKITFNDGIEVFSGTTKLVENRDYTIVYVNNTNVAEAGAMNAANIKSISPAFTVKGKGNYSANRIFYFGITPADISGAKIASEQIVTVAAGPKAKLSAIKPVVNYNGKKLVLNKDYELRYYAGAYTDSFSIQGDPLSAQELAATVLRNAGDAYTIEIVGKEGSNFVEKTYETVIVKAVDGKDKTTVQVSTLKAGDANGKAIKIPNYKEATPEYKAYYDYDDATESYQLDLEKVFGSEGTPLAYVYVKKPAEALVYGDDFTVVALDEDNGNAGKHSFMIVGTDDTGYVGSKTLTYEITGTPLARVKVAGLTTTVEYSGEEMELTDLYNPKEAVAVARGWDEVTLYTESGGICYPLEEGVDYTVSFENTGSVGKCSLVFAGIGAYSGTLSKPVMIKPYNLGTDSKGQLSVEIGREDDDDTFVFTKAGVRPAVTVVFGDRKLREGIDYTLTYKNNAKIAEDLDSMKEGQRPAAVITGKGDFVGTSGANYFKITKAYAEDAITLSAADVALNAKGKPGYFMVAPKLTDNGAAVAIARNKDVEPLEKDAFSYYYAEDTQLPDGTIRYAGERLFADDPIEPGTVILVLAAVHVSEKSPYKYREGENVAILEGRYRFIGTGKDISKATARIKPGTTFEYQNGSPVIPLSTSDIEVSFKIKGQRDPVVLGPDDYEIISVTNNCFLGTATVTLRGRGAYGGIRTVTFKIGAMTL